MIYFFFPYKSFYFVSKERIFVAGKQIKKNKIKRVLQMIFFYFLFLFFYDGDMMIMCFFFSLINHFVA
jgi:hypothetical protein